ncbi:MAG TPA: ankyrin repeat domain-containing protein [Gammaproteobacteria bacterium]|jgi:ankyrin repeat protein|nr:ankyrin repeat domain-containing protein [Gammaproteobacteria bacterium]
MMHKFSGLTPSSPKKPIDIEHLDDADLTDVLENARKKLETITTRVDNKPSPLEEAQRQRNLNLLGEYFAIAEAYYKLYSTNFTSAIDNETNMRRILMFAIETLRDEETIDGLIQAGSDPCEYYYDTSTNSDTAYRAVTAFHRALQLSNLEAIRVLLKHRPLLDRTMLNETGRLPAQYAVENNKVDVLGELYKINPEITNIPIPPLDLTPLHTAAKHNKLPAANWILSHDINACNTPTASGFTALHLAVIGKHLEMANLLLTHGADINLSTKATAKLPNKTPLQIAADFGDNEMVRTILVHFERTDDKQNLDYSFLIDHLRIAAVDTSKLSQRLQKVFELLYYVDDITKRGQRYNNTLFGYNLNPMAYPDDIKKTSANKIIKNILDNSEDIYKGLSNEEYGAATDLTGGTRLRNIVTPLQRHRPQSNNSSPVTPSKLSPSSRG